MYMVFEEMFGITNKEGIIVKKQNKKVGGIRYLPNATKKDLENLARVNRIFLNQMEMDNLAKRARKGNKEREF